MCTIFKYGKCGIIFKYDKYGIYRIMKIGISLSKEAYWKLVEVKVRLRAKTWDEFANRIYEIVFKDEKRR